MVTGILSSQAPLARHRLARPIALGLTGGLLVATVGIIAIGSTGHGWLESIGGDFDGYVVATRNWLGGDGFYLSRQLHGSYAIELGDVLYPPTALYLLVPFTVLPGALWWVVPLGVTSWIVWQWHPSLVVWPLMAATLP